MSRVHTSIIYCSHAEKVYLSALGEETFSDPIPAVLLRPGRIYARVVILKNDSPSIEHAALMQHITPRTDSASVDTYVSTDLGHKQVWVESEVGNG